MKVPEACWSGTEQGDGLYQVFVCCWCDLAPEKVSVNQKYQEYQ